MAFYNGMIAAVPTANRQTYIDHVNAVWPLFQRHGAARMVETWGVDVPAGKVNDLMGAVQAKPDETVVFTWIEWADRATADKGWASMQADPDMAAMQSMPFDGSRMIYGGFEDIVAVGDDGQPGYVQGFALAVPQGNRDAYVAMANSAWPMFEGYGATGMVEAWGVDVPHGKQTDFYRAAHAEEGEVPVFSWITWPDRATCDEAAKKMGADMEGQEMPTMPFDGKRMMWGGFEPIFDSNRAQG